MVGSVKLSGSYMSCTRGLDFYLIKNDYDKNTHITSVNLGDHIHVYINGKLDFVGIVWDRTKDSNASKILISCNDLGIYLLRNNCSYKFNNFSASQITKKVCEDLGIKVGTLATSDSLISRNFINQSAYNIIISSYNLSNSDSNFIIYFDKYDLCIARKGAIEAPKLSAGINLYTSSVSESLNNMVNKVEVFNENDELIKTYSNDWEYKLYGSLMQVLKVNSDEDYSNEAQGMLKNATNKITVENVGNIEYKTGKKVLTKEEYTGLDYVFYIDEDYHIFENGTYKNKLVLNYENVSDDREAGTEIE